MSEPREAVEPGEPTDWTEPGAEQPGPAEQSLQATQPDQPDITQPDAAEQPATTSDEPGVEKRGSEPWFDDTWTRVHPLSPLVQGWLVVVAIPVAIFSYNWDFLVSVFNDIRSGDLIRNINENSTPYLIGGGIGLAVIIIIFLMYTLGWWFTRYKITSEHVMVKSGVLFRQHRQARIDRVQAVDLRQPLMARITGLAELKFEVAEGSGTAVTLAFLRKAEAEQLRQEIMASASGATPEAPADHTEPHAPAQGHVAEAHQDQVSTDVGRSDVSAATPTSMATPAPMPERVITRVPVGRLVGSMIAGPGTLVLLVVLLALGSVISGIAFFSSLGSADSFQEALTGGLSSASQASFVAPLIGAVLAYWGQFSRGFRFTATMTEAGLRLKYGLTETTTQTVPPGRVQAIRISQPVFWRPFGWYTVQVTVAGYGIDQRSTLLPVGRQQDVMAVAAEMFPDLQVDNPEEIFFEGLRGQGAEGNFTTVPLRARLFDPIVRRRRGFFATPSALMLRDGRASRNLVMVPHERIQSLSMNQGPWARRRRVATLMVHLPAGPITPRAKNQDVDLIQRLFEYESGHAATARRLSDRNQWMKPEELREFEKAVTAPAPSSED